MSEQDSTRQARKHLIELDTSGHSQEAWERFEAWLGEDPSHREVFAKVERAWRTVGHLQEILRGRDLSSDLPGAQSLAHSSRNAGQSWRQRWRSISVITVLVIAIIAASFFYVTRDRPWSVEKTRPGEIRTVRLAADATVTLNGSTSIWWRPIGLSREIRVDGGEAAFDVTSHWYRSFLVYVDDTVLRDVGTRFDVLRVGESHVEAIVERGAVVVTTAIASSQSASHPSRTTEQTIQAGQSVIVKSGEIVRHPISAAEIDRRFAWTKGLLVFDGTLADAVAEFNRYNTRRLIVVNPALLNTRVGGRYRTTDPDSFAKYLQITHGIPSKWISGGNSGKDLILVGVHP